jgi:hypothetical protein
VLGHLAQRCGSSVEAGCDVAVSTADSSATRVHDLCELVGPAPVRRAWPALLRHKSFIKDAKDAAALSIGMIFHAALATTATTEIPMNLGTLLRGAIAALLTAATLHAYAGDEHGRQAFSFALVGDVPYGQVEEPKFDRVIADINASYDVRFVVHTGDVKQGSERCDDAVFIKRFEQFQKFSQAFIVTPGDNDWTDCHRSNNGNYLPTERLVKFRQIFYPVPGRSTGQRPMTLRTQAGMAGFRDYVENTMWSQGGVTMATVHVVGSNNDLAPWDQIDPGDTTATPRTDRIAEFNARLAAALAWIDATFDNAAAAGSAGVMIAMQANPNFELPSTDPARGGFNAVLDKLAMRAKAFGKPVLLAHGDSHYFRLDKPLVLPVLPSGTAQLENFSRVENFGSPSVHWVEVKVNARDPGVFTVLPHIVAENVFARP